MMMGGGRRFWQKKKVGLYKPWLNLRRWRNLQSHLLIGSGQCRCISQDGIIELTVTGYNRGGLLVEGEGLNGFVPCSHLVDLPIQPNEDRREDCLSVYVGRTLRLKVIECVPEEGRMVFSERAARAEAGKRPALFSTIQPGQHIHGEVTNITEFGVFVDLGGVEGLIHISELSWGRVSHPGSGVPGWTASRSPGDGSCAGTLPDCT